MGPAPCLLGDRLTKPILCLSLGDTPHSFCFPSLDYLLPGHTFHWLPPFWVGTAGGRGLGFHLFSEDEILA